jgi:ribonuclease III
VSEEEIATLEELEGRLGYRFNEIEWLKNALTHKSFTYQSSLPPTDPSARAANEVLEFLGDAVLNLAVSHLLLLEFPDAQEGVLSKRRAYLVKQSFLAFLSKELRLERHLLLGKGELLNGGRKKSSILANTYEALVGAIYMDSGFDRAMQIIERHYKPHLQFEAASFNDYKSLFQEYAQENLGSSPRYQVLRESGPDHDKRFQASVSVGKEIRGVGWGRSKKEAEQEAARKALGEASTKFQAPNDK